MLTNILIANVECTEREYIEGYLSQYDEDDYQGRAEALILLAQEILAKDNVTVGDQTWQGEQWLGIWSI